MDMPYKWIQVFESDYWQNCGFNFWIAQWLALLYLSFVASTFHQAPTLFSPNSSQFWILLVNRMLHIVCIWESSSLHSHTNAICANFYDVSNELWFALKHIEFSYLLEQELVQLNMLMNYCRFRVSSCSIVPSLFSRKGNRIKMSKIRNSNCIITNNSWIWSAKNCPQ